MKIYHTIFSRGKKGGRNAKAYANKWVLRLTHTDENGKKSTRTWQYATKQDAKDDVERRKAELVALVESKGRDLDNIRTFKQWAEYAKADFYRPAVINEGRKVAGIKAHRQTHILIDHLIACFGDKPLAKFSKYDLE